MDARLHRQTSGSALISAAVAAGVLTILVAGFVSYMANEYLLNFRSHAWTQALHLSEAAIETGFAEFNGVLSGFDGNESVKTRIVGDRLPRNIGQIVCENNLHFGNQSVCGVRHRTRHKTPRQLSA